jgi:hypothetical protein
VTTADSLPIPSDRRRCFRLGTTPVVLARRRRGATGARLPRRPGHRNVFHLIATSTESDRSPL